MKQIKLLDCTLRDGGYINDWRFGKDNIEYTIKQLEKSGTEVLDLGFIKNEPIDVNRTVFNSVEAISTFISDKKTTIAYAVMAEALRPMPAELICNCNESAIDIIRVIIWKNRRDESGKIVDALQEGFEYCKLFADKGYRLYIQPARVEQYTDQEFVDMLGLYNKLEPLAIYIVDSWGTMYGDRVLHYLKLADEVLDKNIAVGFHGHNNMMQAFGNALDFIHSGVNRELIIDGSIYGLGRGAGNLHSEIIAKYLNEYEGKKYNICAFLNIYEKFIKDMRRNYSWGFSPAYFMTAMYHANPQYGKYYGVDHNVDSIIVEKILRNMSEEEHIMYTVDCAEKYLRKYS